MNGWIVNTRLNTLFLQMLLYQEGIDAEIFESVPGKANLMAVLPGGSGLEPPLILHHHMDTAPVPREDLWKYDPWGGTIDKGFLYGIGAIDMKSYGICFLEAFIRAHRERWPLRRPILYLATCAELGREPEKPFKGSFNVRIAPELQERIMIAASQHGMTLNRFVAETLSQAVSH